MALSDVIRRYRDRAAGCNPVTRTGLQVGLQVTLEKTTGYDACNPCNPVTPKVEDGRVACAKVEAANDPGRVEPMEKPEAVAPPADAAPSDGLRPAEVVHREYLRHTFACRVCAAAGKGCGERCPEGSGLWSAYVQAAGAGGLPWRERYSVTGCSSSAKTTTYNPADYRPADAAELARMARRIAHAEALGASTDEAERVADVLHLRDRDADDRRLCLECRHIRADRAGWRCAVFGLIPREWVTVQLQRCDRFTEVAT
ncbi:MAG: hypothetical protein ACOY5G_04030 [Pseudomonadota bacterium]|jgi:hypothetical protein